METCKPDSQYVMALLHLTKTFMGDRGEPTVGLACNKPSLMVVLRCTLSAICLASKFHSLRISSVDLLFFFCQFGRWWPRRRTFSRPGTHVFTTSPACLWHIFTEVSGSCQIFGIEWLSGYLGKWLCRERTVPTLVWALVLNLGSPSFSHWHWPNDTHKT